MGNPNFAGARKTSRSLLSPLERRAAAWLVPRVPPWLETYHLTLLTLVWSALILGFSALAVRSRAWLWGVSAAILCQYGSDFLDGKVGKYRGTGLVRWGFYMDHVLDYVFLCALVIGYGFLLPPEALIHAVVLLAVFAGFLLNSLLAVEALGRFDITLMWLGPSEFRLAVVAINTLLIAYGFEPMAKALPYVNAGAAFALSISVAVTQRRIWQRDLELK